MNKCPSLIAIFILFICATASDKRTYTLSKDYTVSINGTSNLHNWNEKVGIVSGDALINQNSDGSFDLEAINIKMDVHSIKSSEGSIMNNNTYKALKADVNPQIIFTLTLPVKSIQPILNDKMITAKGNLSIAGASKPVDMQVKIFMQKNGKLGFEGSQTIKMTDYSIDPPVALFGTLKTGNEITINFKINFVIKTNPASNS